MNPRRVDACGRGAGPWKRGAREHLEELRAKTEPVSYTHLRAHETVLDLVCRLLLEKTQGQKPMDWASTGDITACSKDKQGT